MSARATWLEARRLGLGGSDSPAVMGLDPWRSPLDIWRSKVQPQPATDDEKFLFKLGHLLEPVIAGLYSEQTSREVFIPNPEIIQHRMFPEIIGSPDRLSPADGRVIELKSEHQFADKFGDPGSDQVPDHYIVQAAHYMAVANLDRCDIAVLHGGFKFAIYQLRRDLDLERSMLEQLREWWHTYVVKKVEPPLDASESWGNYLATKYPFNRGPMVKVDENSNPVLMRHVFNVLNYSEIKKTTEKRIEEAKNMIKAFLAENDGLVGPWGKVTWRLCKDSTATVINFEKVLAILQKRFGILDRELVEVREKCMESVITKKGGRRFVAKRAKELAEQTIPEAQETLFDVNT